MSNWIELERPHSWLEFLKATEDAEWSAVGLQIEEPSGHRWLIGDIDDEEDDYGCGCCGGWKEHTVVRYRRLVPREELGPA